MITRGAMSLVLALALTWPAAEGAAAAEQASVNVSLTTDGGGRMVANSQTNPAGETWSWEACTVGLAACVPFAQGRIAETGGAPAETVFRVTSSHGAGALSPVWHGRVSAVAPPSVAGPIRANELVTPTPAQWSGGWDEAEDYFQLAACGNPGGTGCVTMTSFHYGDACPDQGAVLDPYFTGMYLRVANWRLGPRPVVPASGGGPFGFELWAADPTTAVGMLGRIAPAVESRTENCGAPPLVEASISRTGVATVRCGLGCRAALIARQGRLRARVVERLPPLPLIPSRRNALPQLALPRKALQQLAPGRVRMTVKVDGRRAAQQTLFVD